MVIRDLELFLIGRNLELLLVEGELQRPLLDLLSKLPGEWSLYPLLVGELSCFLGLDPGERGPILLGLSRLGNDVFMALSLHLKVYLN